MTYRVACLLALLAHTARADDDPPAAEPPPATAPAPLPPPAPAVEPQRATRFSSAEVMATGGYAGNMRGVAEDFLVLPDGLDVGGKLRTVTAKASPGMPELALTDLAFFDLDGQWAVARHYELDATATFLPKQPSTSHEHVFQGGSLALRRDLATRTAIALAASASPLAGIHGEAFGGSLFVTRKHRLNELVSFALAAGANETILRPTGMAVASLGEIAGHASVLVRVPNGVWGGWLGAGYAVPVYHRGLDPISGATLAPQPRLDLELGNTVQLADDWDLSATLSIIDRGDLASPATRLPILDGGFDQVQLVIGVSRRFKTEHQHRGISDPLIML
jgi:hypothetical protein